MTTRPRNEPRRGANNELLVYGDIGFSWFGNYVVATDVAEFLRDFGVGDTVIIRINSFGGDAFEGVAIYNLLRDHPADVIVKIDGAAFSAASVIAMAGDEVRMAESALIMIHDPWTMALGNAADMRDTAERLDKIAGALSKAYTRKTGKSDQEVRDMMAEETWLEAAEALDQGFVDAVDEEVEDEPEVAASIPERYAARYRHVPKAVASVPGWGRIAASANKIPAAQPVPNPTKETPRIAEFLRDIGVAASANKIPAAQPAPNPTKETPRMKSVMNALGLREDADEKSALEAVNALKKDAADKAALEAQNTKLVKERDDAVQAQESLHEQQVRARVKSLVGKKFTPAEEEDQVKLALQSPELFERLTEQRADIKVLNRDPVGDGQQTQATERVTGADDNGTDFANMVNEIPLS